MESSKKTFDKEAKNFLEADQNINYVLNHYLYKFAEEMKLPDLMIEPIFNEETVDTQQNEGGQDVDAFEEEHKSKHSQKMTRVENFLPKLKEKMLDLDLEVKNFKQQCHELFDQSFELIVIGATNAGKSTFLNSTTKMQGFFNISAMRETANIWRFKLDTNKNPESKFTFVEIQSEIDKKEQTVKSREHLHNIDDIKDRILQQRNNATTGSEEEKTQTSGQDKFDRTQFNEFEIITTKEVAQEYNFKIINDRVNLVDIPGIDDGILAAEISSYIENKAEKLVPVILLHLTAGGFTKIKHFSELVPQFKNIRVSPTIIFTKFEHLINDIKNKFKSEQDDDEDEGEDDGNKLTADQKQEYIRGRLTDIISEYMNGVLSVLPNSKFFIYNPNSKFYGYKFEYGPQNQPGSSKVILKKFAQNQGLMKIMDIVPIQNYLENLCKTTVSTVYQNENCLFLYQFTKTFFENLVLRAQDSPTVKKHEEELRYWINQFQANCLKEGFTKIEEYMANTVDKGIRQYFNDLKEKKIGVKEVTQSVSLSKLLLNNIFEKIKEYIVELEKMLKSNPDSIVKYNQKKLYDLQSQLDLDDEKGVLTSDGSKEESKTQDGKPQADSLDNKLKARLETNKPNMLMKKVFFNPKRYILWEFDERVGKQEKKFFQDFDAHKNDYIITIYQDFTDYVEQIVKHYENKISTIINGLRSEEVQNQLLPKLEALHPGINFINAQRILERWESEINEQIRPSIFYN